MKTIVIIQARMSSSRLPGKVLMPLGNKTALAHVINRIQMCKNIDGIVVAAPFGDNDIIRETIANGAHYYSGDLLDVLDRYYKCAKFYNADRIVRITSDCPFIMPDLVDRLILESKDHAYGSTVHPRTFPKGFDCEVFSFGELEKAWSNANDPYEREHVTPYIISHTQGYSLADSVDDYSETRITLDTPQDYIDLQRYEKFLGNIYNYNDSKVYLNRCISDNSLTE